jgi:hypothetical protein
MSKNNFAIYETRMVEMFWPAQTSHYGTSFGAHALESMSLTPETNAR